MRKKRRMIAICVRMVSSRRWESRELCSARIKQWKQRLNVVKISNGWEILLNDRKNRRMIAICVCLVFFRRWETRTLRSACKMKYNERVNDVNISNGREITHNIEKKSKNDCDLRASDLVSTLEIAWTTFRTHNAMKTAFKRSKYLKRVRNMA